eukprot:SM000211S06640  [mRNA]  locus=s211:96969:99391:+ [translate_table: standard]
MAPPGAVDGGCCRSSDQQGSAAQSRFFGRPLRRPAAAAGLQPRKPPALGLRPVASWQELTGVLLFSAFPFVTVKLIAEGPIGEQLQRRLADRKEEAEKEAESAKAAQAEARQQSPWYGVQRPKWLGPIPYEYPSHLSGEAPGDYGYDILALAKDPVALEKNYNYEILHARWAMLGALGVFVPELLTRFTPVDFSEPVWWRVGYAKLQGDTLDYLGVPGLHIAGAQGVLIIAIAQFLLMLGPEYARYTGIAALEPLGIYLPGDVNYPGGPFDPLGLTKDPASFEDLKVKEMKNGRLAMVAWLGFCAQAAVTGKGPIENLFDFLGDPQHENIVNYLTQR